MKNIYSSTRNKNECLSGKDAILQGISRDGGLYVYDGIDSLKLPLEAMMDMDYLTMAKTVLKLLLPDFSDDEINECVKDAYEGYFDSDEITPVKFANDDAILELFHGPTCAFKDLGLRMLPQLMSKSIASANGKEVMILTATSGDTGKAALEGFKDVDHIGISVFYPQGGVSTMQYLQMATTTGNNTRVCAIEGNFDDAQSNVKKIFNNQELRDRLEQQNVTLSSANSINIGRLIPQVVYYIYAYKVMVKQGKVKFNEPVNFCVPTGNYGNVLAGYYAKMMGLPVNKFIVASNNNNVLYDFLNSGKYDRKREFFKTISPSMDILISSNLERLLYYKSGKDANYINDLMHQLEVNGEYQVSDEILASIQNDFVGGYASDDECVAMIKKCFNESGYVLDPHTACGYKVMKEYQQVDKTPCVLLSTASPYKFTPAVVEALFDKQFDDEFACMQELYNQSKMPIPSSLANLKTMEIRHNRIIAKDEMSSYVEEMVAEVFHD